jgi:molybdate transport system substrate-binding protein
MRNTLATLLLAFAYAAATPAVAADVRVLSAGAVEPGLAAFAELVKRETGHVLAIQYNTAPRIAQRLAAGEVYDVLISPPAAIAQAAKDGKVDPATRAPVGRVGAGVVVRAGATAPDVASVDALRAAVLAADSLVYNTASTGLYLDKLFASMGIAEAIKAKTTRYPDGAAVMEHVRKGKGNELGFGAITEIRMVEPTGLRLAGPLPAAVQNYTSYEAVAMTGAADPAAARAVLALLGTPGGRAAFAAGGVE